MNLMRKWDKNGTTSTRLKEKLLQILKYVVYHMLETRENCSRAKHRQHEIGTTRDRGRQRMMKRNRYANNFKCLFMFLMFTRIVLYHGSVVVCVCVFGNFFIIFSENTKCKAMCSSLFLALYICVPLLHSLNLSSHTLHTQKNPPQHLCIAWVSMWIWI